MSNLSLHKHWFITILFTFIVFNGVTQPLQNARRIVQELCSEKYYGRGYVEDGVNKSAEYLAAEMKRLKLKPVKGSYFQEYSFDVNSHPSAIECTVDTHTFEVGKDFLVDAGAGSIEGEFTLRHFDPTDSSDYELLLRKLDTGVANNEAIVLHLSNARKFRLFDSLQLTAQQIPLVIFTEAKKLTHTIARSVDVIPSLVFFDSLLVGKDKLRIKVKNTFLTKALNKNIIGFSEGKKRTKNEYVVFSAHYDHLGMQGKAMFPGASDNASGVSMLLNLAEYYSKNQPKYTVYFILFSGEEAGLLGSEYFTKHPTFDLKRVKLLTNIDIMGNAENGITVVNGEVYKDVFEKLKGVNAKHNLLKAVNIRGKAANSDHYHFSEMGIPAIFIYSLGGQGYYHDIYDTYENLLFTEYEDLFQLFVKFVEVL